MTTELKRCSRCCMPETWGGITFNEQGVCSLCLEYDKQKNGTINWSSRAHQLNVIFETYKSVAAQTGNKYDCIIPSSGGKDSTWALYTAKVTYGMTPLVVTWNHGLWMSPEAMYNLYDIPAKLDCDHLDFRLGNELRNGIAHKSSQVGGDFCGFCHLGVGSFPARIAKQWNIPLVVYGEPTALYSTTGDYKLEDLEEQDKRHFELTFQGELTPDRILPDGYKLRDMMPMTWPDGDFALKAIYLGNFLEWRQQEQVDIITRELGWNHIQLPVSTKDWDKCDCERGECLREIQKFHRRHVSRAAFQCSKDIRDGVLSREQGMAITDQYEATIEHLDVTAVLTELGYTSKQEFLDATKRMHSPKSRAKG
jgi:N-acetyl sugar amidotransferase